MAPLVGPHHEKFDEYYIDWVKTQEGMLKHLQEVLDSNMRPAEVLEEVRKVKEHYDSYYQAKQEASHQDVLQTVTASWKSPLEKAFLWLGGWRPSLAFQLVYALAGQQIEAELADLLEGIDTPSFASLSSHQLSQVSELQTATNKEEEQLINEMAMLQQSFADQPLLSLAQAHHLLQAQERRNGRGSPPPHTDEPIHSGGSMEGEEDESSNDASTHDEGGEHHDGGEEENGMDVAIQEKLGALEEISMKADTLRVTTLQKVLDILDTYQKAQYLITAGKLQTAVRSVGEKLNDIGAR